MGLWISVIKVLPYMGIMLFMCQMEGIYSVFIA